MSNPTLSALLALGVVSACSGVIAPSESGGASGGAAPPNSAAAGGTAPRSCDEGAPLAPARLWRLSDRQYVNAVSDLFGVQITADVSAASIDGAALNLSEVAGVNGAIAASYQTAAAETAQKVAGKLEAVLPCASGSPDDACIEAFVRSKVARAYRRPLDDDSVNALLSLYHLGKEDGARAGVALMLEAVLQSPLFLWRAEYGGKVAKSGEVVRLSPFELAGLLGFLFLESVPDEALWEAALQGTLHTPEVLAREVERLVALPRVRENLTAQAAARMGLDKLRRATKDQAAFPAFTASARASLVRSGELFLAGVIWEGGLADLLTSRRLHLNAELAALYGIGGVEGSSLQPVDVAADERAAGLLSHPAFIAAHSGARKNDVVHRGLFVYDNVICGPRVPPPPPTVVAEIMAAPAGASERALAGLRGENPRCNGCHALFDSFGLVSERYDAIGAYRALDEGGAKIDETATLSGLDAVIDGRFDGVLSLAQRLQGSPRVSDCALAGFSSVALGRDTRSEDACGLTGVAEAFAASGSFPEMFKALVMSPGFLRRAVP